MFCFKGFRHARAAVARMWPARYYASGIAPLASARIALKGVNARAKVAREAPFDRNCDAAIARDQRFWGSPKESNVFSYVVLNFDAGIVEQQMVPEGSRGPHGII